MDRWLGIHLLHTRGHCPHTVCCYTHWGAPKLCTTWWTWGWSSPLYDPHPPYCPKTLIPSFLSFLQPMANFWICVTWTKFLEKTSKPRKMNRSYIEKCFSYDQHTVLARILFVYIIYIHSIFSVFSMHYGRKEGTKKGR